MTRYAKQREATTCGPMAVLNAAKWAGLPVTVKKDINKCKELCKWNQYEGAGPWSIEKALKAMVIFEVKEIIDTPKLREIDREVDKGRAVVIKYCHGCGGHYMLCIGRTKRYYKMVNSKLEGPALRRMERKTLSKHLKEKHMTSGALFFPMAWSIERV